MARKRTPAELREEARRLLQVSRKQLKSAIITCKERTGVKVNVTAPD